MMNNYILNHFGGFRTENPPLAHQKTYFFENFQIPAYFELSHKSRFLGGLRGSHGFQTFYNVLKCMGEDGFIIFLNIGGLKKPPRHLTYIFDPATNRVNDFEELNDNFTIFALRG